MTRRPATRYLLAAVAALVATLLYLGVCAHVGRLSSDLQYDDVTYALDAADRLGTLEREGFGAFARAVLQFPPHSFFTTLQGMVAFAFGGLADTALYASNAWLLLACALLVAAGFRNHSAAAAAVAVAFVLTSPLAYYSIAEFRPDLALGFVTALMAWCYTSPGFGHPKGARLAGLLLGASLVIKPTFFAHTIAIALGLVAVSLVASRLRARWAAPFALPGREIAWFAVLGLAVAAPFFAINGAHVLEYFWTNARGANARVWNYSDALDPLQLLARFAPYIAWLARFHLAATLVASIAFAIACWRRGERAEAGRIVLLLAVAGASCAVIVWGRAPTQMFFATLHWLTLLAALQGYSRFDRALTPRRSRIVAGCLALAVCALVAANSNWPRLVLPPDARHGDSWNERIAKRIREDVQSVQGPGFHPRAFVFVAAAGPVNPDTLQWVARKQGDDFIGVGRYLLDDLPGAIRFAGDDAYTVVPNSSLSPYDDHQPISKIRPALLQFLLGDPRFEPLTPLDGSQNYYVFANRMQTRRFHETPVVRIDGAVDHLAGLGPEEGPYPDHQPPLPRLRWLEGRAFRVCASGKPGRTSQLRFAYNARVAGTLHILRDESEIGTALLELDRFGHFEARFASPSARECIALRVESGETVPPLYVLLTDFSLATAR